MSMSDIDLDGQGDEESAEVDDSTEEFPDDDIVTTPPPLTRFAQRHRLVIGGGVALIMLGFFAWSIYTLPQATVPGFFGVVQRFSFPLMCLLIAAVGLAWGLKLKSLWTNIAAYAAIATYVIYLSVGWIYENFIAG